MIRDDNKTTAWLPEFHKCKLLNFGITAWEPAIFVDEFGIIGIS
jgi:hypothetical protein